MSDSTAPPAASAGNSSPALPALRGAWRRVLVLALLGVLTVALLVTLSGGRQTLLVLGQADWRLLIPAALIHYGGFALRGRRWQLLLRILGHPLPYWPVTTLLLAGWCASALLPAHAGDLLRVAALRAGGLGAGANNAADGAGAPPVPVADALGSIVLERVLDILAILLLGATFGALAISGTLPRWVLAAYGAAVALLLALGLALLLAPPLMSALRRVSAHRWWQAALGFVEQVVSALRALARAPGAAAVTVTLSLLIWLCDALLLWLALGALGVWMPFAQTSFVAFTVDIVAAVPLTPGGVGQVEAANTALLALVGVAPSVAAAAVLVVRGISYWSFLLVAGAVTAISGVGTLLRSTPQPSDVSPVEAPTPHS